MSCRQKVRLDEETVPDSLGTGTWGRLNFGLIGQFGQLNTIPGNHGGNALTFPKDELRAGVSVTP